MRQSLLLVVAISLFFLVSATQAAPTPVALAAHADTSCTTGWYIVVDSQPQGTTLSFDPARSGNWRNYQGEFFVTVTATQTSNSFTFTLQVLVTKPNCPPVVRTIIPIFNDTCIGWDMTHSYAIPNGATLTYSVNGHPHSGFDNWQKGQEWIDVVITATWLGSPISYQVEAKAQPHKLKNCEPVIVPEPTPLPGYHPADNTHNCLMPNVWRFHWTDEQNPPFEFLGFQRVQVKNEGVEIYSLGSNERAWVTGSYSFAGPNGPVDFYLWVIQDQQTGETADIQCAPTREDIPWS